MTVACARCHDHKYDPFTARDYYALAGVFASTAYKEYPLVGDSEAKAWRDAKKAADDAEKELAKFLDEQSIALADRFATEITRYMTGGPDCNAKVQDRWNAYLAKPEENHPFLRDWFATKSVAAAEAFQTLILTIREEKKKVDLENKRLVEVAQASAPKVVKTIVLPGGYRSEEDFNPGADIPARSLERDRFVAWNRIFGEKASPLKFDHELTAELLPEDRRAQYLALKTKADTLKKAVGPQYPYLQGASEFEPEDLRLNIAEIRSSSASLSHVGFRWCYQEGKTSISAKEAAVCNWPIPWRIIR